MVADPPQKLTDKFCKPPSGALLRKDEVLSEQGKGEEYSSGKGQRVEHVNYLYKAPISVIICQNWRAATSPGIKFSGSNLVLARRQAVQR